MLYQIVGNSILVDQEVENASVEEGRGRKLSEMCVRREGVTTIVISGIPDIMARGVTRVDGQMVTQYEELTKVAGLKDVILCSFYPP